MWMETRFLIIIPKVQFFHLLPKPPFFNEQKLFKKEFTRVDHVWLHFLEVLDLNAPNLGQKSCLDISNSFLFVAKTLISLIDHRAKLTKLWTRATKKIKRVPNLKFGGRLDY